MVFRRKSCRTSSASLQTNYSTREELHTIGIPALLDDDDDDDEL